MASKEIFRMTGISKKHADYDNEIHVLNDFEMKLDAGEFVSLVGPSGSGKSTLLHIAAGLDLNYSGTVAFEGKNYETLSERDFDLMRSQEIGMIFQDFSLLSELTAVENVKLALLPTTLSYGEKTAAAIKALQDCGLGDRLRHKPRMLSGGQKQRVAFSRALVGARKLVLADEPTANLDLLTAANLLKNMRRLAKNQKVAFLIATHDPAVISMTDRSIHLDKGAV